MSPLLGLHLKHLAFLSLFCLSAALCSSPLISFPLYPAAAVGGGGEEGVEPLPIACLLAC
uniref:Uncharacterized protein n=1 Tax=Zea mays TaxID=4577 RepID=C4J4J1_MAIZE|nr:unknown [Zea mays]